MLRTEELRTWVDRFGAPEEQVRRDHFISHVLASLPKNVDLAFIGGTALCRTHLLEWRLSEDVDLLVDDAHRVMHDIEGAISSGLRREFPSLTVQWVRERTPISGVLSSGTISCRLQIVPLDDSYARYPTAMAGVELRYGDLPPHVDLRCPTLAAATAMKLAAWADRAAPRDLCDLYGIVTRRSLVIEALDIVAEAHRPVQMIDYANERTPTYEDWQAALGHQMRELPDPKVAIVTVREAIERLIL
jgi:predicted nucleotidyltransferase component of viral defense system